MMYLAIAIDSVSLKFPLIRYGKFGKSNPSLALSPAPNHCEASLYVVSSQSRPVQARSNRKTWPLPLMPQYPSLNFPSIFKDIIIFNDATTKSQFKDFMFDIINENCTIIYIKTQFIKQNSRAFICELIKINTFYIYQKTSSVSVHSFLYCYGIFLISIYFYLITMTSTQQKSIEQLSELSLSQILEKQGLSLDVIFSTKDILGKIKRQMKPFIEYCKLNKIFTIRMIQLGLKTPINENSSPQLKNLAYVSSDILTSDHDYIANLLIMSNNSNKYDSDDEEQIEQQIQTQQNMHEVSEEDKYIYLNSVFSYFQDNKLEENCINYITKCLQNLARRRLSEFLQYLSLKPQINDKLIQLAYYPSVAHFLAKLVSDDEDDITPLAIEVKHKIIPLLLQKIHNDIASEQIKGILQCIEEILNSSRYADSQERSILQKISDVIVSQSQINFHLQTINSKISKINQASFNKIHNSISYLNIILARMNMDQQSDFSQESKPYKPTLKYAEPSIFPYFCELVLSIQQIQSFKTINETYFKLLYVKLIDLLILMAKHSHFGQYYSVISKDARINSIILLVSRIANRTYSGILLQLTSSILQKIIISEQKISQSNPESPNKVSPSQLYLIISKHYSDLRNLTKLIMEETSRQRNKNEEGIYIRKLLVILDNFFKNKQIHKGFDHVEAVEKLFPAFNLKNCKNFTDFTVVLKHPAYTKKIPSQFVFIEKHRNYLDKLTPQEIQNSKISADKRMLQEQTALLMQTKFANQQTQQLSNSTLNQKQVLKIGLNQAKQIKIQSPTRTQVAPQPCLLFFIRHLAIY